MRDLDEIDLVHFLLGLSLGGLLIWGACSMYYSNQDTEMDQLQIEKLKLEIEIKKKQLNRR